jgi:uncharacterized RDD family membrane protein YckC
MSDIAIDTTHHVRITFEVAPLTARMLAAVIDAVLVTIGIVAVVLAWGLLDIESLGDVGAFIAVVVTVAILLAPFLQEVVLDGQTIGKRIARIRVMQLDGSAPTMGAYFARWFIGLVEVYGSFGVIATMSVMATRNHQRLGDLVAGSVVVRVPAPVSVRSLRVDEAAGHVVTFPGVRFLSDEDVRVIRDVLHAHAQTVDRARMTALLDRTADRVAAKIGARGDEEPRAFLVRVLADFGATMR